MKKKIIFSAIIMIMIFLGIRCTEDFLTPKPLSFYAPENSYIDANGLNSALIACLQIGRAHV